MVDATVKLQCSQCHKLVPTTKFFDHLQQEHQSSSSPTAMRFVDNWAPGELESQGQEDCEQEATAEWLRNKYNEAV